MTTPTTPQETTVTTPTDNKLYNLLTQLQDVIDGIKQEIASLDHRLAQPTPTAQADLVEAVQTVLTAGDWFDDKVRSFVTDSIDIDDVADNLEDKVNDAVGSYMNNSFDISDYVNIRDEVNDELNDVLSNEVESVLDDILADKIDVMIADKLDEILESKINEILRNKTFTLNL
jgi:capsid protein